MTNRFPNIELPTFDGVVTEYRGFIAVFKQLEDQNNTTTDLYNFKCYDCLFKELRCKQYW